MTKQYFDILGIPPTTDLQLIKKAYRKKAKLVHPDRNPSPKANEEFLLINEAYESLVFVLEKKYQNPSATVAKTAPTSQQKNEKTPEELRAERIAEAKKRYAYFKQKEAQENEAYYQRISSGKNWILFKIIMVGCALLSLLLFIDFLVLPSKWETTTVTHGTKIQNYAGLNYQTIVPVKLDNGLKLWVQGSILGIAQDNPTVYLEKTPILHETKQIRIWNKTHWIDSKNDFSVGGTFPLIPIVLLLPFLAYVIKGRTLSFSMLYIFSYYLYGLFLVVLLYSNDRWLHILSFGWY